MVDVKNWILKTIIVLMMLLPIGAFAADCENPLGKTYQYNGITVHFVQGYGSDTIAQINVEGGQPSFFPYIWDREICTATLMSDPPVYLEFDERWFDVKENPYRFAVVTSLD